MLGFDQWSGGTGRFLSPTSWRGEDVSSPFAGGAAGEMRGGSRTALLKFIFRIGPEGSADLWVRANHVGIDGVPVQDVLTRLENAWGCEHVLYPTPEEFAAAASPRACGERGGQRGILEVQTFLDFSPLLQWRKRRNATLAEPMIVSAAFLWCAAHHEQLRGLFMGSTVEIQAVDKLQRGVGVVVVRPADFFDRPDGLSAYVTNFNRQVNLTRQRRSPACKTIDAAAFLPAKWEREILVRALEDGRSAFGSLALSVIREAKVFGAPIGDAGHADGFIALGRADLPTADGRKVACVTIKGPAARVADYPAILRQAIEACATDFGTK
jgi:hypothetical protein